MTWTDEMRARYGGALAGRVALVTGAGSGIGRAIAIAYAHAGAGVAVLGRRPERLAETAALVEAAGRPARSYPADVRDAAAVAEAVGRASTDLGALDIAVAASGTNAWGAIEGLEPERLRDALATNVEGVANVARAIVPAMRERGAGRLIVVASDVGRRPEAGGSGYVASKFGAVGLALSVSHELYGAGVSVHVIEPGCVDTDWYSGEEGVPRERMLRPDDVALAALFLATLPSHVILEEILMVPRGLLVEPWA